MSAGALSSKPTNITLLESLGAQSAQNIQRVAARQYQGAYHSRPVGPDQVTSNRASNAGYDGRQYSSSSPVNQRLPRPSSSSPQNQPQNQRLASIVGSRTEYVEHHIPKRVTTEKRVRRKKMVPMSVSESIEDRAVIEIKEKIIEVAEPPQEQIVYNDIVKEKKVKRTEIIEKKVPRIEYREKIVEVPETEYVEVPYERIVEVPQVQVEVIEKKVKVPHYVDRYVPVDVPIETPVDVHRRIPKPVEAVTEYSFNLPHLKPKYKRKELPIYAPRFIEVPVPAELMDAESQRMALHIREQIHTLAAQEAPALAEVEKIAAFAKHADFQSHISCSDYQQAIEHAWRNKQLTVQNGMLQSVGHNVGHHSNVQSFGAITSPTTKTFGL